MGIAPGSLSRMQIPKMAGINREKGKGKGKKQQQQHKYETRARTDSRPENGDEVNFDQLAAMIGEFELGQSGS